jgi:hypothetical protein
VAVYLVGWGPWLIVVADEFPDNVRKPVFRVMKERDEILLPGNCGFFGSLLQAGW